jgi:xanthine dehydrogenase accessory factor
MAEGETVALATVIHTWGSSPRRVGAKMAFTPDGKITGSVSGGCVETAVFEAGVEALVTGRPRLLKFGVADETAWEVGLACGGQIEVFVRPLEPAFFQAARAALLAEEPFAWATVVAGPGDVLGCESLAGEQEVLAASPGPLGEALASQGRRALKEGRSQRGEIQVEAGPAEAFVEVVKPPPTLVIVGGGHIAVALTAIASTLGFRTVVVDPRRAFGNTERFPDVDRLIQAWPQEAFSNLRLNSESAVAMLTHDPKIDDPAVMIALDSPAFYVGALGSRKTQDKRRQRLLAEGVAGEQLDRLHGPIGMEIGAETPEEIALAIMAEVVAAYRA